jgi:chemotaxis protein histidine kinase CheA
MTPDQIRQQVLGKFKEVSGDRLEAIGLAILNLEKDANDQGAFEELARELHTLKGEARMLGLAPVGEIAHASEDVLKALREQRMPMSRACDLLLRACDAVSILVDDITATLESVPEISVLMKEIAAEVKGAAAPPPQARPRTGAATRAATPPSSGSTPTTAAPPTIPGAEPARPQAGQTPAARAGTGPTTSPGMTRPGTDPGDDDHVERKSDNRNDRSIRVAVDALDHLGSLAGDLLVEGERGTLRIRELTGLLQRYHRVGDRLISLSEGLVGRNADLTRDLGMLEGDLHLLRDDAFRYLRKNADGHYSLRHSLDQLADKVAEARLVPCSSAFGSIPRAVRDMSHEQGKDVAYEVHNGDVGVDRNLLGVVQDSLVHAIRNAMDHGIETPAERVAVGKPKQGHIHLRLRADGGMLTVEVQDDGRGIHPTLIRQVAVEKGMMPRSQAQALSDKEAVELIFLDGFSTRSEVSDTSGRGVGMSVVKRKVEAVGGAVSLQSTPGVGTRLTLRMPQTLALLRVLLIRMGDDVYGLPASEVEEVGRIDPAARLEVSGVSAVRLREKILTLVALGPLLGLNGGPRHERPLAVYVRHADDRAALVVDGFVGEREVAVKTPGAFLKGAKFVSGAAVLEDGRVAVLLHLPDIMGEVRRSSRPAPLSASSPSQRLRLLVVDDSPIARVTQAAMLRALGHHVEEAVDGEEGFERACADKYDLIFTDMQMPRLDGVGLCKKLRADGRTRALPVVVLSSLAAPEDKRRGLEAGADAYLVKGELSVEALSQVIQRLTG